jgi:hypothetical protein
MTAIAQIRMGRMLTEDAASIRKLWGWILALGIVQILVGFMAIAFAFFATLASVVTLWCLVTRCRRSSDGRGNLLRNWTAFFWVTAPGKRASTCGWRHQISRESASKHFHHFSPATPR